MGLSPQQEIFMTVKKVVSDVMGKDNTFDLLPINEVPYPFAIIGEQDSNDIVNKSTVQGSVMQTIHIYQKEEGRGTLSKHANEIQRRLRELKSTKSFYIYVKGIHSMLLTDTSVRPPLLHLALDVTFRFM